MLPIRGDGECMHLSILYKGACVPLFFGAMGEVGSKIGLGASARFEKKLEKMV